ncbi:Cobyrinic acid A,C-diamide synthase [Crinalium epipsammum PCC 9333]|uniref:Cobyrinate a,c-diamide synthase n=1 Tax=Crinalium epipsammum PCC 9333 TaxID=1173022 RepID=K9W4P3_9CYAN|nr:cobyrinate a,c-diamide synthase [Crinalium epipsammum]AFZ14425.1 Cobyrinic acid A,C-diamide synthase [Crinalium epipsammum PCC 9333]
MALVIAGERSGVGKTTITLAMLACLQRRGLQVQSFKVGPDYIDPMFHQYVTGGASRNLDPVLTSEDYVQQCFTRHIQSVDYALVEGVMGLFDGVKVTGDWRLGTGKNNFELNLDNDGATNQINSHPIANHQILTDFASTAHIARLLSLPVVLVIDCSRLSGSVAAIAHGYLSFDPRLKIAGVVLNRVGSDRHLELLQDALEPSHLPILGTFRRQDNINIPDRHLGLVPTGEIAELDSLIDKLAYLGETCFNWELLLPLLKAETNSPQNQDEIPSIAPPRISGRGWGGVNPDKHNRILQPLQNSLKNMEGVRIAVARDRAFNFYYQDNLDQLKNLGAELIFWSPLTDTELPENVQGMYFGGGFPEVFAQELSNNTSAKDTVKKAILAGMPTYAECGGLMYLCEDIVNFEQQSYPMVGVLPTTAVMSCRLSLGYRIAIALQDSPLLSKSATVWGHEFHRSFLSKTPTQPLYNLHSYSAHTSATIEGWSLHQLHASYVHLHFGANPQIPLRFWQHCYQWQFNAIT